MTGRGLPNHESEHTLSRHGALAVVTVIFGYQLYQERHKPNGVEISIGERGISVEKK